MKELSVNNYDKLMALLKEPSINIFFARAVIEKKADGNVYVDDIINPKTYYVIHKYGMSLLFGFPDNTVFNAFFLKHALNLNHTRNSFEWMQAYPETWNERLQTLFSGKLITSEKNISNQEKGIIELNTRLNFIFNREIYLQRETKPIDNQVKIDRTNKQHFTNMRGSVTPAFFWRSSDEFLNKGVGFSLFYDGHLASIAFSSFIIDNHIEIGIETIPEYRGKGFAEIVCSALIDYCIVNNYVPVWACRLENGGSVKLAHKLGFEISKRILYYRLSN